MPQATPASTTRRALFAASGGALVGAAAGSPAVIAAALYEPPKVRLREETPQETAAQKWDRLIEFMTFAHPDGREVALKARHYGLPINDLKMIMLYSRDEAERTPALMFKQANGTLFTYGPGGFH